MKKGLLLVFVALLAAAVAGVVSFGAQADTPGLSLSAFGTATVDGVLAPGEWDDAAHVNFLVNLPEGGTTPGTLFVMNDGTNLYLAVRFARSALDPVNLVEFKFDNNDNGSGPENGDDELILNTNSGVPGDQFRIRCVVNGVPTFCDATDTAPFNPNSPIRFPDGYPAPGTREVAGSVANDGTFSVFELSHPLDSGDAAHDFSLAVGDTVGFQMIVDFVSVVRRTETALGPGDIVVASPGSGAPVSAPVLDPALPNGANGWYTSDVSVAWNWTDSGSGVDPANCTQTSASSGEGAAITLSSTCKDLVGNTASDSRTVKIDETAPVLTLSPNVTVNATSPAGATVTYTAPTATDSGGSGVVAASVGCSPASGTPFALGTTPVNCSASDVAGNTQTGSFTVHVSGAAEQLSTLLTQVNGVAPGSSLADKVKQIQAYVAANDKANACSGLANFIGQVNAQKGKKLTVSQAASFLKQVQDIKTALGGC